LKNETINWESENSYFNLGNLYNSEDFHFNALSRHFNDKQDIEKYKKMYEYNNYIITE